MSEIAAPFVQPGAALLQTAEAERTRTGSVSPTLLRRRRALMRDIVQACDSAFRATEWSRVVSTQVGCRPDYVIALEDFVITAFTIAGVLHPVWRPKAGEVLRYQRRTLRLYERQAAGGFGEGGRLRRSRKYIVLHAFDYASAAQGARLYDGRQVRGVAVSFGGPMSSRRYIRELSIRGRREAFAELLPEPYLLTFALLLGCADGLRNRRSPIHILGLGSPLVIVLISYLLRRSQAVSIDATSTYKDADDGIIYGSRPAFSKLDMYRVAADALIAEQPYESRSPYFRWFEQQFPSDWPGLRRRIRLGRRTDAAEVAQMLRSKPALIEKFIPYFTPARSGNDPLIRSVRIARGGSNYWLIHGICRTVQSKAGSRRALSAWVFRELRRYARSGSPKWAEAMRQVLLLIQKYDPA